jgi:hypothetical protein
MLYSTATICCEHLLNDIAHREEYIVDNLLMIPRKGVSQKGSRPHIWLGITVTSPENGHLPWTHSSTHGVMDGVVETRLR